MPTLLASGYMVDTTVGGSLLSGSIDFSTIEIDQSGNQQVGHARFTVTDMANAKTVTDKAFVTMVDSDGSLFKGFVVDRLPRVAAVGRVIDVTCDGIETMLDEIDVVSNRRPPAGDTTNESDKQRLTYLIQTYAGSGPPSRFLYDANYGSTDLSKIQTLRAAMPNQKFKNLTLRQSLERVLAVASDSADYYVDASGRVHTFDASHAEGDAAPYVVRVGTPGAGEISPVDLDIDFDSQTLKNFYRVRAKVRAADVTVSDASSIATYGRWDGYVDAPDADTISKATAVGNAALYDNKTPKVRGSFSTTSPYDVNGATRWKVGQMVTFYSTQHGLAGDQSRIVGLTWKYLSSAGDRTVRVQFGGDRLRLRSGGSLNNVNSVTGEIG